LHERPGGDHADDEVTNRAGERYGDGDEGSDRPRQLKPRLEGGSYYTSIEYQKLIHDFSTSKREQKDGRRFKN
jgi:hypothetical protein